MDLILRACKISKSAPVLSFVRSCSRKPLPSDEDRNVGPKNVNETPFQHLLKVDQVQTAVGATNELSSYLGLAREFALDKNHPYADKLRRIQTFLIDIIVAMKQKRDYSGIMLVNTKEVEEWIDEYSEGLSPKEEYILPGGGKAASSLHIARSVCKKAQISVSPLISSGQLNGEVLIYFQRLSEFLLTVSRFAAKLDERPESIYTPSEPAKLKLSTLKKPLESKEN